MSDDKSVIRLVVTGHDASGKSRIVSAAPLRARVSKHVPGFSSTKAWATPAGFSVPDVDEAFRTGVSSQHPSPGESRLLVVTFPPDSVTMYPDFDPRATGREMAELAPGIAERFDPDHPGMHRTDSLDYGVVVSGEVVLELDDGQRETLRVGDVVVQNGTRHAWRNPGQATATLVFVMLGGARTT